MGIIAVLFAWITLVDVAEADEVQLLLPTVSGSVDGEQNRPCYQTAEEAQSHGNLEVSEQKETVERLVV